MNRRIFLCFLLITPTLWGQFDGAAGTPGSLAISKDSSAIISWANSCVVNRGWMDATNPLLGTVTFGLDTDGIGPADGVGIVSFGDSGSATLSFNPPIADGAGPDFAVFENSFSDSFLELAFVEVSSDGSNFYRFPAVSNYPDSAQIGPFDAISDPTLLHNLAGKHRGLYGTPFDLSELDSIPELDLNQITHVRIIDVVGSINPLYGSQDSNGNYINDPFPSPFPSSGFDLDGVAVLHEGPLLATEIYNPTVSIFPNPCIAGEQITLLGVDANAKVSISSASGKLIYETEGASNLRAPKLPGLYHLCIEDIGDTVLLQLIVQ